MFLRSGLKYSLNSRILSLKCNKLWKLLFQNSTPTHCIFFSLFPRFPKLQPLGLKNEDKAEADNGSKSDSVLTDSHVKMFSACLFTAETNMLRE